MYSIFTFIRRTGLQGFHVHAYYKHPATLRRSNIIKKYYNIIIFVTFYYIYIIKCHKI
jgi:hypothetical protein